ncbi:thioesterase domain-containing protein [Streptomyces sp. NPDC029674]|uniref:thioesterase domain-containing protein n=1 Tax=Streptomyces sp. NPDC029674 TaxID=3365297 RepID=UPI0038516C14
MDEGESVTRDGSTPSMEDRIGALSPAQRELFLRRLQERERTRSSGVATSSGGVIVLREGAAGRADPIVLTHPIGGGVFCYGPLARLLDGPHPVWAIAADDSLADGRRPTVAELAQHYLDLLGERGVEHPALLGGWSFGGLVAHEMARRHASATGRAAPVSLIDSAPWPAGTGPWSRAQTLRAFVEDLLGSSGAKTDGVPLPDTVWDAPVPEALERAALGLAEQGLGLGLDPTELRGRYAVFAQATRAMQRHTPGAYRGRVTLFHAQASDVSPDTWRPLCTEAPLIQHRVPGDHFTLLTGETVRDIASILLHTVNETQEHR